MVEADARRARGWGGLALALLATTLGIGPGVFLFTGSPRHYYVRWLDANGIGGSSEGRAWMRAGEAAVRDAQRAALPLRVDGAFADSVPNAIGYAVHASRGRRLSVAARFDAAAPLFVDLLRLEDGGAPRVVAWLEPGRWSLVHEVEADGVYVARLQPPLGRGGAFAVALRTRPSLAFPIADGPPRHAASAFGVERDAGRRRHEGIDIFAPRGTAVLAVASGVARASTNRLGGNVVWLHAPTAGRTYYYAHLDRSAVGPFSVVRPGDVLGYVGNTGNAATTAPHLHFGIYERGAIDPWPFVQPEQPIPPG